MAFHCSIVDVYLNRHSLSDIHIHDICDIWWQQNTCTHVHFNNLCMTCGTSFSKIISPLLKLDHPLWPPEVHKILSHKNNKTPSRKKLNIWLTQSSQVLAFVLELLKYNNCNSSTNIFQEFNWLLLLQV